MNKTMKAQNLEKKAAKKQAVKGETPKQIAAKGLSMAIWALNAEEVVGKYAYENMTDKQQDAIEKQLQKLVMRLEKVLTKAGA